MKNIKIDNNGITVIPFYTAAKLTEMDLPEMKNIISPILPEGGLGLIFGRRGSFKTFLNLEIAYCVANGLDMLNWHCPSKVKVLYLDSEMQIYATQQRLLQIHNRIKAPNGLDNILVFNNKMLPDYCTGLLNLDCPDHRKAITTLMDQEDVGLLFLDNLSSLKISSNENDSRDYNEMIEWARKIRAQDKSILFTHHEGKASEGERRTPRGSSKLEDALDTVINLQAEEDGKLKLIFTKNRHMNQEQAKPLSVSFSPENGFVLLGEYKSEDVINSKKRAELVAELKISGKTNQEIADIIGLKGKSSISEIINNNQDFAKALRPIIDNYFKEKKTYQEIAKLLNLEHRTFLRVISNCYEGTLPDLYFNSITESVVEEVRQDVLTV